MLGDDDSPHRYNIEHGILLYSRVDEREKIRPAYIFRYILIIITLFIR
jgi:hypothetical protein